MSQSSRKILPVIAGSLLAGVTLLADATAATATTVSDRSIVPGVRVGAIYGLSTPAQLRRIYGRNLVMKRVYEGEGTYADGAVIFAGTRSEIRLFWRDGRRGVRRIVIPQRSNAWTVRSRGGRVLIGANILRVVEINGRHFRLQRENDGHNCTSQWRGGRLSPNLLICFREARRLSDAMSNRISRHKGMHTQMPIVGQVFVANSFTIFLKKTRPPQKAAKGAGGKQLTAAQARCKRFLRIKSRRGGARSTITFINRSGAYRTVMWLNYTGRPKTYANLNNGQRRTIGTAVGHPWMITDGPGNCLEIRMPRPGRMVIVIRPDNRHFGPE